MSSNHGRTSLPPALFVGLALPLAWTVARWIIYAGWSHSDFSTNLIMTSEGVGFAMYFLVIAGMLELHRRMVGAAHLAIRVALAGLVGAFASDIISGLAQFSGHWWEHKWIFKLYDYGGAIGWLVFAIGMTIAIPAKRRLLGVVAIGFVFLTWPTELLRGTLYGWMHLGRKGEMYLLDALYAVRYANLLGLALFVNAGTTTPDTQDATSGFKLAAKALWLRVVVALSVSMLTLMMMVGRGNGGYELLKLALTAQAVVTFIAFVMFGAGIARAARSAVPGLNGYALALAGGASLWAAGVTLSQFPHLYRMLYSGDGDASWSGDGERDMAQALAITLPLVVTLGTALIAPVLSRFAADRGDSRLHTDAHSWGVAYVLLMIVAVAIQSWALPKAESMSSLAMMMLFAAGAGLWATILMARLLGSGADSVDSDPSLPTASIVNAGT